MDYSKTKSELEKRHAQAQLRLAGENDKVNPDILRVNRYEHEITDIERMLAELEKRMALLRDLGNLMGTEISFFKTLLANGKKYSKSEIIGKIKFKDKMWEDLFFEYIAQSKLAKISRKFGVVGEEMYEKP